MPSPHRAVPVLCCGFTCVGVELFIAGESYAGFYIPWMAEHIVKEQLMTDPATGVQVRDTSIGTYSRHRRHHHHQHHWCMCAVMTANYIVIVFVPVLCVK
jgi:hypothetical protein